MFGVQDEEDLECADQFGVGFEVSFVELVEHEEEVLDVACVFVGFVVLPTDPVAVGIGSDRGDAAQQAINLLISHLFILVHGLTDKGGVLFGMESGQCCNGAAEHSHGMRVISEGVHHG